MSDQVITACIFLHKDGKLFVAKRAPNKKIFPEEFELPGGHIEFGETIEEGLRREIREELHIEINLGDPFYAFTYLSPDKTQHIVDINYFATMKNPSEEIAMNEKDHTEYRWITEEEVVTTFLEHNFEGKTAQRGFALLRTKTMNIG